MSQYAHVGPIAVAQHWTFHHADGTKTPYVIETMEDGANLNPHAAIVTLLNLRNGKYAHVTTHWLRRHPGPTGSHWTLDTQA